MNLKYEKKKKNRVVGLIAVNLNATKPNVTKKVIIRSHTSTNPPTVLRQTHKINDDSIKKFIPSPELIVDASQSSESNEKFIIKNHHHIIPVSHLFYFVIFFNVLHSCTIVLHVLNRLYYY